MGRKVSGIVFCDVPSHVALVKTQCQTIFSRCMGYIEGTFERTICSSRGGRSGPLVPRVVERRTGGDELEQERSAVRVSSLADQVHRIRSRRLASHAASVGRSAPGSRLGARVQSAGPHHAMASFDRRRDRRLRGAESGRAHLALDSSGLSITSRGEWIAHKYHVPRSFVKLHAAVDVSSGALVAATATSGRSGDAKWLPELIRQASRRLDGRIVTVFADGAYDTRDNFDLLRREGIEAIIHIRKNANMKMRGGTFARPRAVKERNELGEAYWRFVKRYGRRWMVEGAFSAIKRMLGDGLRSRRDDLRLREAQRKAVAYTRLLMA